MIWYLDQIVMQRFRTFFVRSKRTVLILVKKTVNFDILGQIWISYGLLPNEQSQLKMIRIITPQILESGLWRCRITQSHSCPFRRTNCSFERENSWNWHNASSVRNASIQCLFVFWSFGTLVIWQKIFSWGYWRPRKKVRKSIF